MRTPQRSTQPEEGAALRDWRQRSGFKQSELAKRTGLSQNLLSLLEAGKRNFTKDSTEKIYRAVDELNRERAERLASIALNQDSRSLWLDRLQDKTASKEEIRQIASTVVRENASLRSQVQGFQQAAKQEIGPRVAEVTELMIERNIKPLTAKITELESQLADLQRLVALKTEAVGKEAEAQELQEKLEQRVRKGE